MTESATPAPAREIGLRGGRGSRRSDAGFAIPMVFGFLIALAFVGAAATVLTTGDLKVAGLYSGNGRAGLAAGSGLEHAIGVFRDSGSTARWPVHGDLDRYRYTVGLVRDSFDFGSGRGPVSYDDRRGGYPQNTADRGQPLWILSAAAVGGSFWSRQELRVARRGTIVLPAAITVAGRTMTEWFGADLVSGLDSDPDGVPVDPSNQSTLGLCDENRPGFHFDDPLSRPASIQMPTAGNSSYASASPPFTTAGPAGVWQGLEAVLDVRRGELDSYGRTALEHQASLPDSLFGLVWLTDLAGAPGACLSRRGCASIEGRGILIVHNPLYDPAEHDPTSPRYDPVKALSPLHAPARLADITGGTFRGLVVVDAMPERPTGAFAITGALAILGHATPAPRYEWPPGTLIRYSCEALSRAALSSPLPPHRLGWKGQ